MGDELKRVARERAGAAKKGHKSESNQSDDQPAVQQHTGVTVSETQIEAIVNALSTKLRQDLASAGSAATPEKKDD